MTHSFNARQIDIRNIVHLDLPSTIEEYSQQIGRAGRDGEPSVCMFYICRQDFYLRENFARGDLPSRRSLRGLIRDIFTQEVTALPVGSVFVANHTIQTKNFDIRQGPLSIIYALLELEYGLIRTIQPQYKEYTFLLMSPTGYRLLNNDMSPEARAIFDMSQLARKYYSFDISAACETRGLLRADVLSKLNSLHDSGIIDMKGGGVQPRYRVLTELPSKKEDVDDLVCRLYRVLSPVKKMPCGRRNRWWT